jgi:hypothetical protein
VIVSMQAAYGNTLAQGLGDTTVPLTYFGGSTGATASCQDALGNATDCGSSTAVYCAGSACDPNTAWIGTSATPSTISQTIATVGAQTAAALQPAAASGAQLISGISNTTLAIAGIAVLALFMIGGRR